MLDYLVYLMDDANDFSWELQKPVMWYFCAEWNKGKLRITVRLKKLTGLGKLMHRSTSSQLQQKHKKVTKNHL